MGGPSTYMKSVLPSRTHRKHIPSHCASLFTGKGQHYEMRLLLPAPSQPAETEFYAGTPAPGFTISFQPTADAG